MRIFWDWPRSAGNGRHQEGDSGCLASGELKCVCVADYVHHLYKEGMEHAGVKPGSASTVER